MRGASGAAARSRHRPSGRVKLPMGLLFCTWPRQCRTEPESASSSLFGYTKRLVQLEEKVIHFLENYTRFWLKRWGPRLGFSVLQVSFDAFAGMPGLYNCFWLGHRSGQGLGEKQFVLQQVQMDFHSLLDIEGYWHHQFCWDLMQTSVIGVFFYSH